MLTKPQFFYDNTTKQALGFQNPFYLQKTQQSKPKLYVGDIIVQTNPIVIPDSQETLALAEESRSKMLLKHKDNMMLEKEKQVDTTPKDYAALNQLHKDFPIRFVPQTKLSAEQAFWSSKLSSGIWTPAAPSMGTVKFGLGHNLFSVGQFCDSNLEVAFRQYTCYIRNLEGVDLLTGSQWDNLYTLSLGDMMASSSLSFEL
ncbi:hypothetical protein Tco_0063228 [Tanacetum coccineum]